MRFAHASTIGRTYNESYREKLLFSDVTFGVKDGDKIGIIGVNGTGKSTFLKVSAGLIPRPVITPSSTAIIISWK